MEDYKEGYLMVWANYMSPCKAIAGLYFEGTCDVISVPSWMVCTCTKSRQVTKENF